MKQQTAVEWFADHLKLVDKNAYNDLIEILEQAKQMEKEQIVDAHYQGYRSDIGTTDVSEQYYNEKYGK